MSNSVYLDYNATTPVDDAVLEAMQPYWQQHFANASSDHTAGRRARQAVDNAREQVAAAVGAKPSEVIFTASGTESNNTIVKGVAKMSLAPVVAVSAVEHPCILCAARSLQGAMEVDFIAVTEDGLIDLDDLQTTLKRRCALVSVMTANNETGVLQDIPTLAETVKAAGAIFHTDAAQALGKIPLSFAESGVDAMTVSGHKCYGPKGIAALIVRSEVQWAPLLEGGGHERGYRSGTEHVTGIVGFGKACELAAARALSQQAMLIRRDEMEKMLTDAGAIIFGSAAARLPNTCYFGFPGIDGDAMVTMLDQSGFAVASGAACSSMKNDPSHVLLAMGLEIETARTAVRVSFGVATTDAELRAFAQTATTLAMQIKQMSAVTND